jgi:Family of unknown function (DUF6516)
LTTLEPTATIFVMKAVELIRTRIVYSETVFAELVLWKVPKPITGSTHLFKYRLAFVVNGVCVIRYDNEAGKGDHRHLNNQETPYTFTTPDKLIADFQNDISRWK